MNKCIAAIGSGGKTSLLTALALTAETAACLTTTTHTDKPLGLMPVLYSPTLGQCLETLKTHRVFAAGTDCGDRLGAPESLEPLRCAGLLLIEADGSKKLPLKLHAEYEPVIPEFTDEVLCVCGMNALGRTIAEAVHRSGLSRTLTGRLPHETVDESYIALLIELCGKYTPKGARFTAALNRVRDIAAARRVRALLDKKGIESIIIFEHGTGGDYYERIAADFNKGRG